MREKYHIATLPTLWDDPLRCSPDWKELIAIHIDFAKRCNWKELIDVHIDFAEPCNWKVGRGNISFWYDNWNSDFDFDPFADGDDWDMLSDFWQEDHWNFEAIIPKLGVDLTQYTIKHAPIISDDKDTALWKLTKSEAFTVKSAWHFIRRRGTFDLLVNGVWDSAMPNQNKILICKLLHVILPTDLMIKRRRYQLASKCICCVRSNEESLHHLFIEGELTSSLWKYFGTLFGMQYFPNQCIYAPLAWWFHNCNTKLSLLHYWAYGGNLHLPVNLESPQQHYI